MLFWLITQLKTGTNKFKKRIKLNFSIDDSISEAVLNCMSTIVVLACRTGNTTGRDLTLKAICRAALPQNYFSNYIDISSSSTFSGSDTEGKTNSPDMTVHGEPSQVIAMSSVCPIASLVPSQFNTTVMVCF